MEALAHAWKPPLHPPAHALTRELHTEVPQPPPPFFSETPPMAQVCNADDVQRGGYDLAHGAAQQLQRRIL
eukprot:35496-Chlamydomonas_euryale.AAC.2